MYACQHISVHSITQTVFICIAPIHKKVISWHFPNWASLHHTPWLMYLQGPRLSTMSNTWGQWWETTSRTGPNGVRSSDQLAHTFIHWCQKLLIRSNHSHTLTDGRVTRSHLAFSVLPMDASICQTVEDRNQTDPVDGHSTARVTSTHMHCTLYLQ